MYDQQHRAGLRRQDPRRLRCSSSHLPVQPTLLPARSRSDETNVRYGKMFTSMTTTAANLLWHHVTLQQQQQYQTQMYYSKLTWTDQLKLILRYYQPSLLSAHPSAVTFWRTRTFQEPDISNILQVGISILYHYLHTFVDNLKFVFFSPRA